MSESRYHDLADCTEFRQTLQAKPPALIHGTALLIVALIVIAVVWAARTEADLVVRAQGRVRPMVRVDRLADAAAEESNVSPSRDGRVTKVHVREGDKVRQGQLLVELDTERLRNDVARHRRTIKAAEAELASIKRTETLLAKRFAAATVKAQAEVTQAEGEIRDAKQRRAAEIKQHTVTLDAAKALLARLDSAFQQGAVTSSQRDEARNKVKEATALVEKAGLPVDAGKLKVLQQAAILLRKDYDVEVSKLHAEQQVKQGKLNAARLELANVELELRQSELRAPIDGTITSLKAKVGDMIQKGQQVVELVELHGYRIDLAVTSDDVGQLKVGMPVRIKLDAYDFQKYGTLTGRIVFVSPDSQVSKDNAAPRYIVKVALDSDMLQRGEHLGHVKLGMTGSAEIVTDRENLLSLLVRSLRRSISLG
jgi:membrane fusion protein, hemolysin D